MYAILIILILFFLDYVIGMRPERIVANYSFPESLVPRGKDLVKGSVIVIAEKEDISKDYLDILFSQDYPDFEVIIVICDTDTETIKCLNETYQEYKNLYFTFLPEGTRRVSRGKLSRTLGIKRASGDIVILTSTQATPVSASWLSSLLSPFNQSVETEFISSVPDAAVASIGVVVPDKNELVGRGKSAILFDAEKSTIQWLAAAIKGEPFRCNGLNLAFRRNLFFDMKGYSSSILLEDGEDDIYLMQLSSRGKCIPVISKESMLMANTGQETRRLMTEQKKRHLFTGKFLPRKPFVIAGFSTTCQWLAILPLILSSTAGLKSLWGMLHLPGHFFPTEWSVDMTLINNFLDSDWTSLPDDWINPDLSRVICMGIAILIYGLYRWVAATSFNKALRRISPGTTISHPFYPVFGSLRRSINNLRFRIAHSGSSNSRYTYRN